MRAPDLDSKEIAPYLATLLAIPTKGHYPRARNGSERGQKERTIDAMIAMVVDGGESSAAADTD